MLVIVEDVGQLIARADLLRVSWCVNLPGAVPGPPSTTSSTTAPSPTSSSTRWSTCGEWNRVTVVLSRWRHSPVHGSQSIDVLRARFVGTVGTCNECSCFCFMLAFTLGKFYIPDDERIGWVLLKNEQTVAGTHSPNKIVWGWSAKVTGDEQSRFVDRVKSRHSYSI